MAKRRLGLVPEYSNKRTKYNDVDEKAHLDHKDHSPTCPLCLDQQARREQWEEQVDTMIEERDENHESRMKADMEKGAKEEARAATFGEKPTRFWHIPKQWEEPSVWAELRERHGWTATKTATASHTGHATSGKTNFAKRRDLVYPGSKKGTRLPVTRTNPAAVNDQITTGSLASRSSDELSSAGSVDGYALRQLELEFSSNEDDETSEDGSIIYGSALQELDALRSSREYLRLKARREEERKRTVEEWRQDEGASRAAASHEDTAGVQGRVLRTRNGARVGAVMDETVEIGPDPVSSDTVGPLTTAQVQQPATAPVQATVNILMAPPPLPNLLTRPISRRLAGFSPSVPTPRVPFTPKVFASAHWQGGAGEVAARQDIEIETPTRRDQQVAQPGDRRKALNVRSLLAGETGRDAESFGAGGRRKRHEVATDVVEGGESVTKEPDQPRPKRARKLTTKAAEATVKVVPSSTTSSRDIEAPVPVAVEQTEPEKPKKEKRKRQPEPEVLDVVEDEPRSKRVRKPTAKAAEATAQAVLVRAGKSQASTTGSRQQSKKAVKTSKAAGKPAAASRTAPPRKAKAGVGKQR